MEEFTQTFFVAIIGIILSLISFLVPLTYRFLRNTAKELGNWKGKDWYYNLKKGVLIQQIRHYYIFADAITDIIAVYGAISVLSIVVVMSGILIPQISLTHNIPFNSILSGNYNTLTLSILLSFLYLVIWNIAWWDFERYLEDNLSYEGSKNAIKIEQVWKRMKDKKWGYPIWMIVRQIILIFYTVIFAVLYRYLPLTIKSEAILLIVVIGGGFLLTKSLTKRAAEPTENNMANNIYKIKEKFHLFSKWLFLFGLFLIATGACFHTIFVIFSDNNYLGYGVIVMNIIILISFFLYWFLLGIVFTPNTALVELYAIIEKEKRTQKKEERSSKKNESSSNGSS